MSTAVAEAIGEIVMIQDCDLEYILAKRTVGGAERPRRSDVVFSGNTSYSFW